MKPIIEVLMSEQGDIQYRVQHVGLTAESYGMILSDLLAHLSSVLSAANGTFIDREAVLIAMTFLRVSETPPSQRLIPQGSETIQ